MTLPGCRPLRGLGRGGRGGTRQSSAPGLPPAVRSRAARCVGSACTPPPQRGSALPGVLREQRLQEPAEALGTGAQVNNLKQYGTSLFKESPLKKQSLYLTVDRPPKDRPQKPASVRPETSSAHHAVAPSSRTFPEAKLVEFDSLKASNVPVCPPSRVFSGLGVCCCPWLPIVDELRYSQRTWTQQWKRRKRSTCF